MNNLFKTIKNIVVTGILSFICLFIGFALSYEISGNHEIGNKVSKLNAKYKDYEKTLENTKSNMNSVEDSLMDLKNKINDLENYITNNSLS